MGGQGHRSAAALGDLIRESRQHEGLTQQALADLSGVRVGTIRDVEQGRTASPRRSTVSAILHALDLADDPAADPLPRVEGTPEAEPVGPDVRPVDQPGRTGLFILVAIAVERDGRRLPVTARTQRDLVVRLALAAGSAVDQDDLFEAVWDRERRPGDEAVLHSAIARLRRVVDPVPIVRIGHGYTLEVRSEQLDWLRFRDVVRRAEVAESAQDAFDLLRGAMAMWRGFPGELVPWVGAPFEVWDVHRQAARQLATSGRAIGRAADVVPHLRNALTIAPYDEAFHAELMLSLAASGRRTEALIVYRDVRRALLEEHGVEPGTDLVNAHATVLSARAGVHGGVMAPRQAPLPPRAFVGRDAEVGEIVGGQTDPAATSGYLRAAGTTGPSELFFHLDGEFPVASLGETAAASLDVPVTDDPTGLQVWIDGRPYDVAGFVGSDGPAALGNAVVVPYRSGVVIAGDDGDATVLVRAVAGAGARVAGVVATAIRPDAPERLEASPVVSVDSLRRGVTTQMDRLAAWTGVILMSLTILLIANSMVVAVMARTAEIGLRRALGSTRMHVAGVFLTEGALVGFLGGLVGAAVASAAVVITASANGWTAVLDVRWISVGPVIGTAVGLLASAYPAQRASAVHPALAVRAE